MIFEEMMKDEREAGKREVRQSTALNMHQKAILMKQSQKCWKWMWKQFRSGFLSQNLQQNNYKLYI